MDIGELAIGRGSVQFWLHRGVPPAPQRKVDLSPWVAEAEEEALRAVGLGVG